MDLKNDRYFLSKEMIKVMFVCHGNICRSPMAEFVFRDMVKKEGLSSWIQVESVATSREEIGNGVHPGTKRKLSEHGISTEGKRAVQLTKIDYANYDYLIGMDEWNIQNMLRIVGADFENKICRLLEFTDRPGDIADPWYTGDFESTYKDVLEGCEGLLRQLKEK